MNQKDKEAFEKWELDVEWSSAFKSQRLAAIEAWQAACEHKQAELAHHIFKIEAENAKLRECVESFVDKYFDLPLEYRMQKGLKECKESLYARQALKELDNNKQGQTK